MISAKNLIENGERNSEEIKNHINSIIETERLAKVDYIEVVDSLSIEKVDVIDKSVLVAIAVYIGKTRLIDNFTFEI